MEKQKNNRPHKVSLNDNVLNLLVNVISDMLGLKFTPNAIYNDKTIVYHLLNAASSKTSVSNICYNAPSEGTIKYKLKDIDLDEIQKSLNEKFKNNNYNFFN
jgi:putative transposase